MTEVVKESVTIYKTFASLAFIAMILQLSIPFLFSKTDCLDTCQCCCESTEVKEVVTAKDCCSAQVIVVKEDCCGKEHLHETHFLLSKSHNFQNILCDLRSSVFNKHILNELSGIANDKRYLPVEIVYYIFKPPIA